MILSLLAQRNYVKHVNIDNKETAVFQNVKSPLRIRKHNNN